MYLKKIDSYGFKSFANRTTIEFEQGMNVIVGPNGSGKSNIVDATRWVLGEQSAKMLRGGNMQDIIFKGSTNKKKLGYAEVTLILDNSDGMLPLEYEEISVTRRLYRSGESLYLINNQKVRLQDITNLFMDSGIGKESFSIIGQGRIDEILNSKPIDRRAIFEEAAGVLKYKTRKEQSLRRLERTHTNLTRVNDIIEELSVQVAPLEKQAAVAKQYLTYKDELQKHEVDLLVYEIKQLATETASIEKDIAKLSQELIITTIDIEKHTTSIEAVEQDILLADKQIQELQEKLVHVTQEAENVRGTKRLHQQKIEYIKNTIQSLTEDETGLQERLKKIEVLQKNSSKVNFSEKKAAIEQTLYTEEQQLKNLLATIETKQQEKISLLGEQKTVSSRYHTLKEIQDTNQNLYQGVRAVVDAKKQGRLQGIEGTIVELIDVADEYTKAIEVALGTALQNIITNTQQDAENAVRYLKQNNRGRATFYPLDVLARQTQQRQTEQPFSDPAVIGYAYDLLSFDPKYQAVFKQLLGQTLILTTLEAANKFAKATNFRYRIVTLDGEIVHRGGSITGGHGKNEQNGLLMQRKTLEQLAKRNAEFSGSIEAKNQELAELLNENRALQEQLQATREESYKIEQQQQLFEQQLSQLNLQKQEIEQQVLTITNKKTVQEQELVKIDQMTAELNDSTVEHDNLKEEIIGAINEKRTLRLNLDKAKNRIAAELKNAEQLYRDYEKQTQKLELSKNTAEIKGNDRIARLQELYNCSYQNIEQDVVVADYEGLAKEVNRLRVAIDKMGMVNLGAIDEYERVSERYQHLTEQRDDLVDAENNLLAIINEMDEEMEERFMETFKVIQDNFAYTFKRLFGGGTAELALTDKGNILESGIEIFAQPPGKKIQSLSLLSGGERALTAIALLFAILRTKAVPFCVLDEVEAALDEANVERFAKYLKSFSEETQFIVVSHRKGTMEAADILYGVTMEEAGVSKILSVKLQDANKYIEN